MKSDIESALNTGQVTALGDELPYKMQVAAAALLVYAAKADGTISEDELDIVMRALAREFKRPDADSAEMIEVALYLYDNKKNMDDFATMLKASLLPDQREYLFKLVAKVIRADGRVSVAERVLAGDLAKSLGLEE